MKTVKLNKYPIILPKKKSYINTPEDEFKLHGIFVVAGKRGIGKSCAVSSKLRHLKSAGFADRIFLISPTAVSNTDNWHGLVNPEDIYNDMNNTSVESIIAAVEDEAREWEEYCEAKKMWDTLQKYLKSKKSIDEIPPKFLLDCFEAGIFDVDTEQIKEPVAKYGHRPVFHMVLDDCQSSRLFVSSTTNKFLNLCIRHRHVGPMTSLGEAIGLSIWVLIQNYSTQSGLPKAIRGNCTNLLLFKMQDEKMLEKIMSECGGEIDKQTFINVYNHATKEPHDFLSIEFSPKKPGYMFRKCFDELILPPEVERN